MCARLQYILFGAVNATKELGVVDVDSVPMALRIDRWLLNNKVVEPRETNSSRNVIY